MKELSLLCLICSFLLSVHSQLPSFAQQFTGNATTINYNTNAKSVSAWNWDFPNKKSREDVYVTILGPLSLTAVNLLRFDQNTGYNVAFVFGNPVNCAVNPVKPMNPWGIPSNSNYKGTTTYNNVQVDIYSYTIVGLDSVAYVSKSSPVVLMAVNTTEQGAPVSFTTYSYFSFSPQPASTYEVDPSWGCH
eukprot:TRINITY_DN25503_c0_g1_i1.p1 TRINITY_DN25503_c0_g1~~TRINITY_DN25503_c0_g1_i1.p1  ORF type:complete len:207 (-),score=38.19 TRINITY_DN25503_c0_g1_i1:55-624(-)